MNDADDHRQQLSIRPSTALVLATIHNKTKEAGGGMNAAPAPDSVRDLTYRLFQHAVYTAFLAIQLFILPLKKFVRRFIPHLYKCSQGPSVIGNIAERTNSLHNRLLLRWPLLRSIFSAWSHMSATLHKIDCMTALLEQNIELMSMKRVNEEKNDSPAPREACLPDDETVISPVTASAIYHAALANNRTLDNLLDTFDGGRASTISCPSIDERNETRVRDSSELWAKGASLSQSAPLLPIQKLGRFNGSSSETSMQSMQASGDSSNIPRGACNTTQASLLKHRSPAPSISTATPQSSPISTSSSASGYLGWRSERGMASRREAMSVPQARCTACGKGHIDAEKGLNMVKTSTTVEAKLGHKILPQSRGSAIPRRNAGFVVNHRARACI